MKHLEVLLERKQKYEVKKLDEVVHVVTIDNKVYEQHNKLHSNSGRAERANMRRNETPSGHVSERRAKGEAGGGIRNETSCYDELRSCCRRSLMYKK